MNDIFGAWIKIFSVKQKKASVAWCSGSVLDYDLARIMLFSKDQNLIHVWR
jgi:hypothetical protein